MKSEKPHKKLVLWQKAIGFVVLVYEVTKSLPREEEFGLKSQLRRAAVSLDDALSEVERLLNGLMKSIRLVKQ